MLQSQTVAQTQLLTPRQAAERLSISERKLWGLTAPRGPVPCVRIGRSVRYRAADLDGYAEQLAEKSLAKTAITLDHAAHGKAGATEAIQ